MRTVKCTFLFAGNNYRGLAQSFFFSNHYEIVKDAFDKFWGRKKYQKMKHL
jgi:hypothetical protein